MHLIDAICLAPLFADADSLDFFWVIIYVSQHGAVIHTRYLFAQRQSIPESKSIPKSKQNSIANHANRVKITLIGSRNTKN